MKKTALLLILCLTLAVLVCSCVASTPTDTQTEVQSEAGEEGPTPEDDGITYGDIHISSVSELNSLSEEDDHKSAVGSAVFELNYRERVEIPRSILGTTTAYYPRIKKVSDNNYLLFYNLGKTDPSCYVASSTDLVNWQAGVPLFEGTKSTYYATCDAVVLSNGDIVAAASFRPTDWGSYTSDMEKSGIVLRRSSDGGKTWSEIKKIYTGMNWEPYLIQLRSGELQCFFTHTAPYTYLYGYNTKQRSTGVGLIRSYDNGASWTPNVTAPPYSADIASQTYIGDFPGYTKMFTEQMPAVVELHCGTMLMACETQPDFNNLTSFRLSITRSYDNWAKKLALDEQGPADKQVISGVHASGPYVAQMLSGESVISFYGKDGMNLIVGNSEGKNFSSATQPMAEHNKSYWGSLEVLGSHALLGVCDDDGKVGNVTVRRISAGVMYLNHDLYAKKTAVTFDGNGEEWKDNTDALFVGSSSQAQATVRFTEDENNVYVLIERLDSVLDGEDITSVFISGKNANEYYKISVSPKGIYQVRVFRDKKPANFNGEIEGKVVCVGTLQDNSDTDTGYACELKLSRADFGLSLSDGVYVTVNLENKDAKKTYAADGVCGHDMTNPKSWTYVSLK